VSGDMKPSIESHTRRAPKVILGRSSGYLFLGRYITGMSRKTEGVVCKIGWEAFIRAAPPFVDTPRRPLGGHRFILRPIGPPRVLSAAARLGFVNRGHERFHEESFPKCSV